MELPVQYDNETTSANVNPVRKVWSAPTLSPVDVVDVTEFGGYPGRDGSNAVSTLS